MNASLSGSQNEGGCSKKKWLFRKSWRHPWGIWKWEKTTEGMWELMRCSRGRVLASEAEQEGQGQTTQALKSKLLPSCRQWADLQNFAWMYKHWSLSRCCGGYLGTKWEPVDWTGGTGWGALSLSSNFMLILQDTFGSEGNRTLKLLEWSQLPSLLVSSPWFVLCPQMHQDS